MFQFGHKKFSKQKPIKALGICNFLFSPMAVLWSSSSISLPLPSLQPPIPSTITSKCSISNPHIPKTFRIGFPYLTHQPLCCSYSTSQSEPPTSPSTGVFIKGLPQSTAEGRLKKVFSQFGEVKEVHVVRERVSKQSLGSAFVWFDNEESVRLAVNELNGKFFDGRFVSVKIAVPGLSKKRGRTTPYKF